MTSKNDQGVTKTRKRGRWRRRLLIAVPVAVALYALVGFFVVPWVAQRWVVPMLGEQINGTLRVGQIKLNPFTLALTVEDAAVEDEAGEALLGFARFHGNLQASSGFREGFVLRTVELDGPFAHAVLREDGTLNLADVLKPSETEAAEPWTLPRVRGEGVVVRDGLVSFRDRMVPDSPDRKAEPLTFTIGAFDSQPLHANTHRFSAQTEAAEQITWEGQVYLNPLTATGRVEVDQFDLSLYHPYIRQTVPVRVDEGRATLALTYELAPAASPRVAKVHVETAALDGLKVTLEDRPLLSAQRLEVVDVNADAVARSVVVGRVGAVSPAVAVKREADGTLPVVEALEGLLAPPTPANAPASAESSDGAAADAEPFDPAEGLPRPLDEAVRSAIALSHDALQPWKLEVVAVAVEDSGASWRDEAVSPAAEIVVQDATLTAGPIRSDEGFAVPFEAGAALASGGTMSANGRAEPLASRLRAETFAVDGLEVSPAVPYLAQAVPMVELRGGSVNVHGSSLDVSLPVEVNQPPNLAVGELEVTAGGVDVSLTDVDPNATLILSEMSLKLTALDTASSEPAAFSFAAKPNGALVTADGTILPDLADPMNATVNLEARFVDALSLAAFSGYSGKFVGRRIATGTLATDQAITVKLAGKQLDALVPVKIEDFNFGEKVDSPDAVKLPVGLAVAILKGPDGTINPPAIPIKGDLTDPSVSVGGLVVHALTNLVTGIVASPFKMLAGALGGEDDQDADFSFVAFAPGDAALSIEATHKLKQLHEALAQRPALSLALAASPVGAADENALRKAVFLQRLREKTAATLPAADPRRADPTQINVTAAQYRDAIRLAFGAGSDADDASGGGVDGVPVLDPDAGDVVTEAEAQERQRQPRRRIRGGRATRHGPTETLNDEPLLGDDPLGLSTDGTDASDDPRTSDETPAAQDPPGSVNAKTGGSFDFAAAEAEVLSGFDVTPNAAANLLKARLDAVRNHLVNELGLAPDRVGLIEPSTADPDAGAPESPRVTFELGAS